MYCLQVKILSCLAIVLACTYTKSLIGVSMVSYSQQGTSMMQDGHHECLLTRGPKLNCGLVASSGLVTTSMQQVSYKCCKVSYGYTVALGPAATTCSIYPSCMACSY